MDRVAISNHPGCRWLEGQGEYRLVCVLVEARHFVRMRPRRAPYPASVSVAIAARDTVLSLEFVYVLKLLGLRVTIVARKSTTTSRPLLAPIGIPMGGIAPFGASTTTACEGTMIDVTMAHQCRRAPALK